jgi:topoisomerase-4 subunit A
VRCYLIKHPNATIEARQMIPDQIPTGGVLVQPRQISKPIARARRFGCTPSGPRRIRAAPPDRRRKGAVSGAAARRTPPLLTEKSCCRDVRDGSAEEIRLVLEPKHRRYAAQESLFRLTELEVRFGLNMNVLSAGQVPNVLSLRDVLRQWLEHRVDVLVKRSQFRLKKIEHRLEVLDGYLVAYLNLDEVIRIVRFEDDPKQKLMARFKLTEVQADAILNLRLKSLSKLEEMQIRGEHDKLSRNAAVCSSF